MKLGKLAVWKCLLLSIWCVIFAALSFARAADPDTIEGCEVTAKTVNGPQNFLNKDEYAGSIAIRRGNRFQILEGDCHVVVKSNAIELVLNNSFGFEGKSFIGVQIVRSQKQSQALRLPVFQRTGSDWRVGENTTFDFPATSITNLDISKFLSLHSAESGEDLLAVIKSPSGISWHATLSGTEISTYAQRGAWQWPILSEQIASTYALFSNRIISFSSGSSGVPINIGTKETKTLWVRIFCLTGAAFDRTVEIRFKQ